MHLIWPRSNRAVVGYILMLGAGPQLNHVHSWSKSALIYKAAHQLHIPEFRLHILEATFLWNVSI